MGSLGSIERPWPDDMTIGGVGVSLIPDPNTGEMVASTVNEFEQVIPSNFTYSDQDPYKDAVQGITRVVGGLGLQIQQTKDDHQYRYGINLDVVGGGLMIKGPLWHSVSPSDLASVANIYEALSNGALALFSLSGRYVEISTDGGLTWTRSKDLGAGVVGVQAARFKDQGGSPLDAFYVATSSGDLWQYSVATWTKSTALANNVAVVGDRLYIGYGSTVRNTKTDPLVAANFSAAIQVSNPAYPITWLVSHYSQIWILKTNTVCTLNSDGSVNDLFEHLRLAPSATNGVNARVWDRFIWTHYGDTLYALGLNGAGMAEFHPISVNHLIENTSEIKGVPVCFVGYEDWYGYFGLYDSRSGNSYLMKIGSWVTDESGEGAFKPIIHGALTKWTNKQITSLTITSIAGPQTTVNSNLRLLAGFSDGTISWAWLPKGTPNPIADSLCEYTTDETDIYLPYHTGTFPADNKQYRGVSLFGPTLGPLGTAPNSWCKVAWKTDQNVQYADINGLFQMPGQRLDFPLATAGKMLDCYVKLFNKTSAYTPVLEGIVIHEALRPARVFEYQGTANAERNAPRQDGSVSIYEPEYIRRLFRSAINAPGAVTCYLPWGSSEELTFQAPYREVLVPKSKRGGMAWHIQWRATQFRVNTVYGTIERLAPYTIGDLSIWTIGQLGDVDTSLDVYGSISRFLAYTIDDLGAFSVSELGGL